MNTYILIVTTAWQFYSTGVWSPATSVSMQEFGSQLACGRAADVVRSQIAAQTAELYGKDHLSVHAICLPRDAK